MNIKFIQIKNTVNLRGEKIIKIKGYYNDNILFDSNIKKIDISLALNESYTSDEARLIIKSRDEFYQIETTLHFDKYMPDPPPNNVIVYDNDFHHRDYNIPDTVFMGLLGSIVTFL